MAARAAARMARHTPSPDKHRHKRVTGHQRLVYREIFNKIDADGSGGLDTDELVAMFRALDVTIERDRVGELVEQYSELYHDSDDDDGDASDPSGPSPSPTSAGSRDGHRSSRIDFDQFVMMARDLADAGEIDKRALKGLVPESAAALAPPDSLEGRRLRAKRLYDSLVSGIVSGMACLHTRDPTRGPLLHHDLKPSNVLVFGDLAAGRGRVILLPAFGLRSAKFYVCEGTLCSAGPNRGAGPRAVPLPALALPRPTSSPRARSG